MKLTKKQAIEWVKKLEESLEDLKNPKTSGVSIGVNKTKNQADLLFEDENSSEITGTIKFLKKYFEL